MNKAKILKQVETDLKMYRKFLSGLKKKNQSRKAKDCNKAGLSK